MKRYERDRVIIRKVMSEPGDRYRVIYRVRGDQRIYESISRASRDRLISRKELLGAELDVW